MLIRSRILILFLSLLLLPFSAYALDIQWASDISLRPQSPKAGEQVTFQLTVRADRHAVKDFTVVGAVDGKRIFRKEIALLKANRSRHLRFKWTATRGAHKVSFQIVGKDRTRAASPARLNMAFSVQAAAPARATRQFRRPAQDAQSVSRPAQAAQQAGKPMGRPTVPMQFSTMMSPVTRAGAHQPTCEGRPLPDIEILHGSGMRGSSILNSSGAIEVVLPFSFSVVLVNRGQCDTGIFSVKAEMRVQAPGVDEVVQLGSKGAPSLKPCRTSNCGDAMTSVRFEFTPEHNHGYYDFTIEADASHSIIEFNEENNEIHEEIRIDHY